MPESRRAGTTLAPVLLSLNLEGWRTLGSLPRGSINTPIVELGSQNHSRDGLSGANSIIVVYMDPLGKGIYKGSMFEGSF